MTILGRMAVMAGLLMLAACATTPQVDPTGGVPATWKLDGVSIRYGEMIGRTATGEDYNSNFVWQGDNGGNRKRQVISMFRDAANVIGRDVMTGTRPVRIKINIDYFHALNDWARLFCCGAHRIYADVTITDAASGEVLADGQDLALGRVALGGIPGLVAVAAGRDQRLRVTEGIARNMQRWLAQQ